MHYPFGETVTILRTSPGGTDPYGDPIDGEDVEVPVEGCAVWTGAMAAEQLLAGREPSTADRAVSFPYGTDVRRTDRLRIRGEVFEVSGDPFEYRNPFTGTEFGVLVYANRGEG